MTSGDPNERETEGAREPAPGSAASPKPAPSMRMASPILALLLIWIVGGLVTVQLGRAWGWSQHPDTRLRAGTMRVAECHRDIRDGFLGFRCTGDEEFAPVGEWDLLAQRYLTDRPDVPLSSREDIAGAVVGFTCYNTRGNPPGVNWARSDHPVEVCFPDSQEVSGIPKGKALWIPLGAAIGTFGLGLLVSAILMRRYVTPTLRAQGATRTANPG